jgi:hypothetical protein
MFNLNSTATKQMAATIVASLGLVVFQSGAAAEPGLQKLTGAQIRAKIAGMELSDDVHWRELYERNGALTSSSMGRKRTGKWRVEKDQLCVEFDKEPPAKCYEVWLSGKKVELRREGILPLQGVIEPPSGRK